MAAADTDWSPVLYASGANRPVRFRLVSTQATERSTLARCSLMRSRALPAVFPIAATSELVFVFRNSAIWFAGTHSGNRSESGGPHWKAGHLKIGQVFFVADGGGTVTMRLTY